MRTALVVRLISSKN
ncbi:hypothetical protein Pint_34847 [Pistacia integerrima]|uniref:Uncharacterized protein n=1 Tax=Pistacia integerrima TaxID=434235 RepID=A0ACC0Y190_9ROSI|nr:hypothetical protein Pint_34847 [Pistacia integerrima]